MAPTHLGPLFRRQFVLTRTESDTPPGWFTHRVLKAGHLYHCPDLPVSETTDADGHSWCLLGEAIDVASDRSAVERLQVTATPSVQSAYQSWEGRWVLIGEDHVHPDLMALIPLFHSCEAVSSTPGLLSTAHLPRPRLSRVDTCDWFPAPLSGLPGINRLLPTQILRLGDRTPTFRPLPTASELSQDEALALMGRTLIRSVTGVKAQRIVIPLTAGWDSRLVLAACVSAGVDAVCVTLTYPGLSTADYEVPPLLAELAGYQHLVVRPTARDPKAASLYDRQVGGHIREMDRRFMVRSQYDWVMHGDVLLRGLGLDITRMGYHRSLPAENPSLEALIRFFKPSTAQEEGLKAYFSWTQKYPQSLPFEYRFDLEQGCSAMAAMSEIALDLTRGHTMLPGNSATYQAAALALPASWRAAGGHHASLIDEMHAPLMGPPINQAERRRPRTFSAAAWRKAVQVSRQVYPLGGLRSRRSRRR